MSTLNARIFEMIEKHGHCITMQKTECPMFHHRPLHLPTIVKDDGTVSTPRFLREVIGKFFFLLDEEELKINTRPEQGPALHYVETPTGFYGISFQDFIVYVAPYQKIEPGLYYDLDEYDDISYQRIDLCKKFEKLKYFDGEQVFRRAEPDDITDPEVVHGMDFTAITADSDSLRAKHFRIAMNNESDEPISNVDG